jgi:hypothetical protein
MRAVKVGTKIDAELLRRAKVCAARRGKKLREIFEESLQLYLSHEPDQASIGKLSDSWGVLKLPPRQFKEIMELPNWYEIE